MSEKVLLTKNVYNKQQFTRTVDINFETQQQTQDTQANLPSVSEFFNYYQQLFYDIPKFGETNSHQYLITTSQDYIGDTQVNPELEGLILEINSLRQTVLEQQQTIFELSKQQ